MPVRAGTSARLVATCHDEAGVIQFHHEVDGEPPLGVARAKLFSAGAPRSPIDLAALRARLSAQVEPDALYASLARRGLEYGPRFRAVEALVRGDGEVLATLALPDDVPADGYRLHPVLLDAALHSVIAGASGPDADGAAQLVPVAIDRVQLFARAGARLLSHGVVTRADERGVTADLTLVREDGVVVAALDGLRCQTITARPGARDGDARAPRRLFARRYLPVAADASVRSIDEVEPAWWLLGAASAPAGAARPRSAAPARALRRVAPDALAATLEADAGHGGAPPPCVLDLRWASAPDHDADDPVTLGADAAEALALTVRCIPRGSVARYYLVTVGAEALDESDGAPALERAALAGVARTAITERPDLRFTHVDLSSPPSRIDDLLALLGRAGDEQELAVRAGIVHAARIVEAELAPDGDRDARDASAPLVPARDVDAYEIDLGREGDLASIELVEHERAAPGPGQIEIEAHIAPLNFKDVMKALGLASERILRGTYGGDRIGMEVAGVVSALGDGVTDLAVGDRVYAIGPRSMRSHVVIDRARVAHLPDEVSFEDAASLLVLLTAWYSLVHVARVEPGETVLVHGAAGGLGLAAIAVARLRGARVVATAGTEDKRAFLRARGVEHVASSRDVAFADHVRDWTGGHGADVVLSFSPGEIVPKSIACLAPFGRFVELGKMSFEQDAALPLRAFHENLTYAAVDFDRLLAQRPDVVRRLYAEILPELVAGRLEPVPVTTFPASEVADAFRWMARARHTGKVVVSLRDPELLVRPAPAPRAPRLSPDTTYLVTGGLTGFGLACARWLCDEGARHVVVLGRRGAATPDAADFLASARAAALDVRALSVDVSDEAALAHALDDVLATMPPLRGVIHAATVLDDRALDDLDRASLDRVLAAKARGALNLHALTERAACELDFFVLCSSIAAAIGNAGQASYVAANVFLDHLALHRRALGLPATSLQWGALADAGLVARDDRVRAHLEAIGVTPLPIRDALAMLGAAVLDRAPSDAPVQLAVADLDVDRLAAALDAWSGGRRLAELAAMTGERDGAAAASAAVLAQLPDDDARRAHATAALVRVVAHVLRLPETGVSVAQPLRELGMDSIVALEIVAGVERELGMRLSPVELSRGPSIEQLATALLARVAETRAKTIAPPPRASGRAAAA